MSEYTSHASIYAYIQGVSSCKTECALVDAVRCSVQRPVATRQPPDCLPHGVCGYGPLCSGADLKGFRSTLGLPSSYLQFYSKNCAYFEEGFKVPIWFKAYLN